jgi:hypothetical protein
LRGPILGDANRWEAGAVVMAGARKREVGKPNFGSFAHQNEN